MEMQKYKLGEICRKITDGSHFSPKEVEDGYPMFSVKDMKEFGFSYDDVKKISAEDFYKLKNSGCVPEKNDVLVAKDGSYLKESFVCEETKNEAILSSIAIFKPKMELVNPIFLSYLFKTPSVYEYVKRGCVSGTALPRIVLKAFKEIDLFLPPLPTQQKIATVLSSLDKKIALNSRINARLEQMAKRLYEHYFVQFDFPTADGKPYKTSGGKMVYSSELKREIPEGWGVKSLFDVSDVIYGFPYATEPFDEDVEKSEKPYSVIRIRDILENTISAKTTEVVEEKYKTQIGDLLIGMDGYFHMNFWSRNGDYVNQRITRIRKTYISTLILYHQILPFIKFKEERAKGSTVGHLSDKDIKQIKVLIPDNKNISNEFDSILNLIMKNRQKNKKLSRIRDRLLPLLMNGQVSV